MKMTKVMKALLLFVAMLLSGAAHAADADAPATPPGQERALYTMRMFLDLCLTPQAEPKAVIEQAEKTGFRPLKTDAAGRFLGKTSGRAWAVQLTQGEWVLSLDEKGVCTVWAHKVDPKALEEVVSSWLPLRSTGFEAEQSDPTIAPNGLRTIVYTIHRGPTPYAAWVLSTSVAEGAFFQGALSLRMVKPAR